MAEEAVAHLACDLRHQLADSREEDLRQAEVTEFLRVGREERGHQCVLVELATELQRRAVLPGVPDRTDGLDHLAHPGCRVAPLHREALGDVRLDLAAQPEHEAALRERLQIPADVREQHRVAGERDGDRRAELDRLGSLGGDGEREERIVGGLGRPDPRVAGRLEFGGAPAGLVDGTVQSGVDLHAATVPNDLVSVRIAAVASPYLARCELSPVRVHAAGRPAPCSLSSCSRRAVVRGRHQVAPTPRVGRRVRSPTGRSGS